MTAGECGALSSRAPDIDAREQKQPDDVHEVPIPGREFESKMLGWGEMAEIDANQADDEKCRANDHMRAVKTGRHEKGGAVDVTAEMEPGVTVLVGLDTGESQTERNGEDQTPLNS